MDIGCNIKCQDLEGKEEKTVKAGKIMCQRNYFLTI